MSCGERTVTPGEPLPPVNDDHYPPDAEELP